MEHKKVWLIAICLVISIGVLTGCSTQNTADLAPVADETQDFGSGHRLGSGNMPESGHRGGSKGPGFGSGNRPSMNQQSAIPTQIQQSDSSESSDTLGQTTTVNKTVAISNACIGCGKCARMASNTFVMNGHKATIISQEYASSSAVQQAVNHCPVDAITVS